MGGITRRHAAGLAGGLLLTGCVTPGGGGGGGTPPGGGGGGTPPGGGGGGTPPGGGGGGTPPGGGGGGTPPGGGGGGTPPGGGGGGTPPGGGGGGTPPGGGGGGVRVRQDIVGRGANDPVVARYAEAVRLMRNLPASDPRSWAAQANTHLTACPHGNWFFLPWHRAYLWRFEEICREVLGDDSFALPYWNWSRDARIPAPFYDPASPLFEPSRIAAQGSSASAEMVAPDVLLDRVLPETDFELFAGGRANAQRMMSFQAPLEQTPHNHIHVFTGGVMSTFTSPNDPIFWLHHANVDRLWSAWNARGNPNSSDPAYANFTFSDFVDRNGNGVTDRAGDMGATAPLGYSYDTLSVAPGFAMRESLGSLRASTQGALARAIGTAPQFIIDAVNGAVVQPLRPHVLRAQAPVAAVAAATVGPLGTLAQPQITPIESGGRVLARLSGIAGPRNENMIVRVFINCSYLSPATPVNDPHYVGSFSFFGTRSMQSRMNGMDFSLTMDASRAVRRVGSTYQGSPDFAVQLMPVGLDGRSLNGGEFLCRNASIAVV